MEENSYQAEGRVETLKARAKRCVCKYCGQPLRLKRIIFSDHEDARIEIFCDSCDRIEFGAEPQIYQNAKYFAEELQFSCYPDLDDNERTKQMTIAKVCEIMMWGDKNLGLLDEHGFTVPVSVNRSLVGESVILTDQDLD